MVPKKVQDVTLDQKPRVAFVDDQEDLAASLAAKYSPDYEMWLSAS